VPLEEVADQVGGGADGLGVHAVEVLQQVAATPPGAQPLRGRVGLVDVVEGGQSGPVVAGQFLQDRIGQVGEEGVEGQIPHLPHPPGPGQEVVGERFGVVAGEADQQAHRLAVVPAGAVFGLVGVAEGDGVRRVQGHEVDGRVVGVQRGPALRLRQEAVGVQGQGEETVGRQGQRVYDGAEPILSRHWLFLPANRRGPNGGNRTRMNTDGYG